MKICKVRAVFSKPICANKARIGPPSANQGISTDSHNSQHVQITLWVTPPTSPCPILSADAEPARKRAVTIFSAHCAVWRQQKLTLGIKWLKPHSFWVHVHESQWEVFQKKYELHAVLSTAMCKFRLQIKIMKTFHIRHFCYTGQTAASRNWVLVFLWAVFRNVHSGSWNLLILQTSDLNPANSSNWASPKTYQSYNHY